MIRTCKFCRRTADTESVNCPYCNSAYSVDNTMQGQAQPQYQQPVQQPQYVQPEYQQPGFQQPVQQPQYQQPYVMPTYDAPSATGTGALVCGIISIVLGLIGSLLSVVGLILGIIAIVSGIKAKKRGAAGKATGGIVTGIVGFILSTIKIILLVLVTITATKTINKVMENANYSSVISQASQVFDAAQIADTAENIYNESSEGREYCVTIESLNNNKYLKTYSKVEGSVLVTVVDNKTNMRLWLKSGDYYINDLDYKDIRDAVVTTNKISADVLNTCNHNGTLKSN